MFFPWAFPSLQGPQSTEHSGKRRPATADPCPLGHRPAHTSVLNGLWACFPELPGVDVPAHDLSSTPHPTGSWPVSELSRFRRHWSLLGQTWTSEMSLEPPVTTPLAYPGTSPGAPLEARQPLWDGHPATHPAWSTRVSWAGPRQQWPAHPEGEPHGPFTLAAQRWPETPGLALSTNPCPPQATPNLFQSLRDSCEGPQPGTNRETGLGERGMGASREVTDHCRADSGQGWCLQWAAWGYAGHSSATLCGSQGGPGPCGKDETSSPTPLPEGLCRGGTFWPTQPHAQQTARHCPKSHPGPGGWSSRFLHPSGSAQGSGPEAAPSESPEHRKHLDFGNDQQDGRQTDPGVVLIALGVCVRARLLEERLLPQGEPGTLGARGGVVVVAVPGDRETGSRLSACKMLPESLHKLPKSVGETEAGCLPQGHKQGCTQEYPPGLVLPLLRGPHPLPRYHVTRTVLLQATMQSLHPGQGGAQGPVDSISGGGTAIFDICQTPCKLRAQGSSVSTSVCATDLSETALQTYDASCCSDKRQVACKTQCGQKRGWCPI